MSLFSTLFNKLLEEDLKEASTWNAGLLNFNMPSVFKDPSKPSERHRKIIKDPGFRKHTQTVPDMHKIDPKSIQALNDLKASDSGRKALTQSELQQIMQQFNLVRLNPNSSKSLGNTGILLKFDPNIRGYVLEK